ncbi:HD family phosphohydrolase [Tenacibaculum maritimum]|uniref:HD family phosphohydrolase n=2 Tax=Tenacibaculum maritimum TaxID=107401 RepID=UPI0010A30606|nr:HDIG domain-containing metalloprotein [Tenacibaculum maritimum]MCD9584778.1 HDIG domain-containing protein [Tenacibaculum maritimum]MCD9621271.1 HDIG domain-containing protein [Tenacibaculum maritimum]MCD9626825.1 HDIG domain-containing protein [Tenacibaculum maritimum]MCD9630014.1 HDIG domain-containing protein [Tenacibaculum maritimum]MCD9634388.1 HDIG domain-containing protein [Tenacibaculum maritimum]
MNNFINKIYKNNTIVYKGLLFLVTAISIVYLLPKGGQFKYDFNKGKPWQYDNLYATFDFAIQKTSEEIDLEKKEIKENIKQFFEYDLDVFKEVKETFKDRVQLIKLNDELSLKEWNKLTEKGTIIIDKVYDHGFLDVASQQKINNISDIVALRKKNEVEDISYKKLLSTKGVFKIITDNLGDTPYAYGQNQLLNILSEILKPNVSFDSSYTERGLNEALGNISYTKGKVSDGELIILKGDIVEGRKLNILNSLKKESESKVWTEANYNWIVFGYAILVSLALLMLLLFLEKYRKEIFEDNNKVTFIFFNIFLMILIQTMVVKYNASYLYIVPLSILPIILKAFFDARLGLFAHVLTVLLLGFIVPNSFEFIYLHIIAGIVTILTVSELYRRANLFISIGQVTLIYMLTYFAFSIIKEGNASQINSTYFVLFAANGLLSFLSVFFIYFYEKVFGLMSDVTLLELSNTNSRLLRELNEKAPGTFQHSMQVANLAEAAANEIGANSMLVRTGALYHDIGKILNPMYFTENQSTGVNPHNDLSAKDSARIILDHVIKGIELAKKYKLPDRIIDFIRTHHGTSLVYYFYKKEQEENPGEEVDPKKFQYQGPIPFSKETAILMMCDAAEAASKSLKNPTAQSIDNLINKIIEKQKSEAQFVNSDITFREIELIKKVIKKKLMNIYHLRVEYPE